MAVGTATDKQTDDPLSKNCGRCSIELSADEPGPWCDGCEKYVTGGGD